MLIRLPCGVYVNPKHVTSVTCENLTTAKTSSKTIYHSKVNVNLMDGNSITVEDLGVNGGEALLLNAITKISNIINGIEYLK